MSFTFKLRSSNNYSFDGSGINNLKINDIIPSEAELYSSSKINTLIGGIVSGLIFKGTWDPNTNTPMLSDNVGTAGAFYIVTNAPAGASNIGYTILGGIQDWVTNDWVIRVAGVSSNEWYKLDQSNLIVSVNGKQGVVNLLTTDITEGTKLYYTESRVNANTNIINSINHISSISNPHFVTKSQIGLSNVDNTSDVNKPISTFTQSALNGNLNSNSLNITSTTNSISPSTGSVIVAGGLGVSSNISLGGITNVSSETISTAGVISLLKHSSVLTGLGSYTLETPTTIMEKKITNQCAGEISFPLNTGVNNIVQAIEIIGNNVYAGGQFTFASGLSVGYIAKWNGSSWSALGSGTDNYVNSMLTVGTSLYVGGKFLNAGGVSASKIAKLDGTVWSALGSGINGDVNSIAVIGTTNIYAVGSFTVAGGVNVSNIAKWNGSVWSALGSGINGLVLAVASIGTDIYAAGSFTVAGGVNVSNIAKWNGSVWSALGSGLNNFAISLLAVGTDLYVGGGFTSAGVILADKIAKYDTLTSVWSALGSGIGNNGVNSIASYGNDIVVTGNFTVAGGVTANRVARWNGSSWFAVGNGVGGNGGNAIKSLGTNIFVGGDFTLSGTLTVNNIVRIDFSLPTINIVYNNLTYILTGNKSLSLISVNYLGGYKWTDFVASINTSDAIAIKNTTSSTSTTSGAITVTGGVGVGENINIAGNTTVKGNLVISSSSPVSGSTVGVTGTITFDSGFIYICTNGSTSEWKKVAIS
jgi:hypothetical protein